MGKLKDLTGQKFGRLIVIKRVGTTKGRNAIWLCKCECGNKVEVFGGNLTSNSTKSCGCLRQEQLKTHGLSYSNLYPIWIAMKDRCFNCNNKEYHCYGGRGITVCDEWKNNFKSFYNWANKNGYKDGLTIDRINNNKGYSSDNCKWSTMKEQANNKSTNNYITYNGETHTLTEWAEKLGIKERVLSNRINRLKWTIEKAFNAER